MFHQAFNPCHKSLQAFVLFLGLLSLSLGCVKPSHSFSNYAKVISAQQDQECEWFQDKIAAFIMAAGNGEQEKVEQMLSQGIAINSQDSKYGLTALIMAAGKGNKELVVFLLEHGADINQRDKGGDTALMMAAVEGHTDIVELLIDQGADTLVKNNKGLNALKCACLARQEKVMKILLQKGQKEDYENQMKEDARAAIKQFILQQH